MSVEYESVWSGREPLTDALERDYADMKGDGWDLFYVPPSPLTTPWEDADMWALPDPDAFVVTSMQKKSRRRQQPKAIAKDWQRAYNGTISQGS